VLSLEDQYGVVERLPLVQEANSLEIKFLIYNRLEWEVVDCYEVIVENLISIQRLVVMDI
jgi:hypothetical protein